ncbi:MAG TPA: hypothetical protein VM115_02880 [Vicinamibacterales bacterium]|nr:hypothetical protein [Vicinamibacterales bacterium]
MSGQRAEGRGQNAATLSVLRDGMSRVNRAPVVVACVFVATLLTALPLSLMMRDALQTHLGNSLTAEQVARGVNVQWWTEFTKQAGTLGKTFQTGIIGFAAVLDNLNAFADGDARPSPLLWLGAAYLLLWLFLAGGILDRYARARPTRSYEFFTACGVFFVRFLRLAPFIALTYYVLFAVVHPMLLDRIFGELTRDVTVERTAFVIRVALYAVFGVLVSLVSLVFDYAKVRAVVEDRRSMIGAMAAGARFARRNLGAVAALYILTGSLFIALLVLYSLVAPGARSTGAGIWIGVAIGQLYVLGRVWIRLVFFASETALFQSRLAHAGYIASAPVTRAEPPLVENAV